MLPGYHIPGPTFDPPKSPKLVELVDVRRSGGVGFATQRHLSRDCLEAELEPGVPLSAIAEFGALIGEPTRIAMLVALMNAPMLPAGELAVHAGVSAQTASGHLAKLATAGIIAVRRCGRRRMYHLASAEILELVRALYTGGSKVVRRCACGTTARDEVSAPARVCRDHLAGALGVQLAAILISSSPTLLYPAAVQTLAAWGLPGFEGLVRTEVETCADWSEGRRHISGALGGAILVRSLELGWVKRDIGRNLLGITAAGAHGYRRRFGIAI